MIKGLSIAKAGMLPRQRQLEVNANNLANIDTIGFKKTSVFFRHLLNSLKNQSEAETITSEAMVDFSPGPLKETGNPLDVAIAGEGFFVIQTPEGQVFTRNGNFTLSADGRLTTVDGYSVLGNGGEIQINGNEIKINETGAITVDGQAVDTIRVVTFEDLSELVQVGSNFFSPGDKADMMDLEPEKIQLRQGYLESSNVTGIDEIISMIELYRQFEFGQKVISTQDQTLEKLINDTGRVS
ncbi:MAG: flagellar basal-body rod protein FlgF [Calditrichia bacterium]